MDLEIKKTFLLQGSILYSEMIKLTSNDVIRRYLAFRIIINAMSFEDLIGKRQYPRMRRIRDVLLAHKQEPGFFEGYRAVEDISNQSISSLLSFMSAATPALSQNALLPELCEDGARHKFRSILPPVFKLYEEENLVGFRVINNFLCYTGNSVQEVGDSDLAGVFYRYNSSMALMDLAQYIYNNAYAIIPELVWTARHAKLDMLLHAQNLADCVIKDTSNQHSIDGLLEVSISEGIGNPASLHALVSDSRYRAIYASVRKVRNKLIGHMDKLSHFADLLSDLDALPIEDVHTLVNLTDKAVYDAAQSHPAINYRYATSNQKIDDPTIRDILGLETQTYYSDVTG